MKQISDFVLEDQAEPDHLKSMMQTSRFPCCHSPPNGSERPEFPIGSLEGSKKAEEEMTSVARSLCQGAHTTSTSMMQNIQFFFENTPE
jgi:hypothetical protein